MMFDNLFSGGNSLEKVLLSAVAYVASHKARLGISTDDVAKVNAMLTQWNTNYPNVENNGSLSGEAKSMKEKQFAQFKDTVMSVVSKIPKDRLTEEDLEAVKKLL